MAGRNPFAHRVLIPCLLAAASLSGTQPPPVMFAHFIDVGQADATLLEFPCGAILIDAGAQEGHVQSLVDYLEGFFAGRPDLDRTLAAVFVTHSHIDHTRALRAVVENFTVERYFDGGHREGTGTGGPNWVRANAATGGRNVLVREIHDGEVTALPHREGLTDAGIDPLVCSDCDPEIRVLSGRLLENPGWKPREFDNKNNHSLVIRIDFEEASFLFTGDLEEPAIETLVDWYVLDDPEGGPLDADVLQVGHHGSGNGTTPSLVEAVTPEIAVISVGLWDFGLSPAKSFSTYAFGHPRRSVLDLLSITIRRRRSQPLKVMAAEGGKNFQPYRVRKAIYATGWDGTVKVRATTLETPSGSGPRYIVTRERTSPPPGGGG